MRTHLLWLAAAACSDPNRNPVVDGGVRWATCALQVDGKGPPTQCATIDLPLWPDEPDGPTIELFAQRHLADGGGDRVLWMLPGGPGQTGAVYESFVKDFDRALPHTDLYLFEHRGVGRSTRLGCPDQEAPQSDEGIEVSGDEWPACLDAVVDEWGDDLAAFSSTNAAHDLAAWIELTAGDRPTFVYGGSYGTTLGHRFLQHHDDLVDGVILDSIAIDVDHRVYDAEMDAVGRDLLALCARDERCGEELGPDPVRTAREAVAALERRPCGTVDADTLRAGAGAFLADASLRGFVPSLFSRALRCGPEDRDDLERLVSLFVDRPAHYTEELYSPVLFRNIELSEQWPEPWPTLEALQEAHDDAAFSFGVGPASRPLLDLWPRYPWDRDVDDALAVTSVPLLLLQGGLDPQTPPHRTDAVREAFDGPGQHFVRFPEGGHVLVGSTPGTGGDCALRLVAGFLDDPSAAPDTSCVGTIEAVDFTGQPFTSTILMGGCSRYGKGCAGGSGGLVLVLPIAWGARRRRQATNSSADTPPPPPRAWVQPHPSPGLSEVGSVGSGSQTTTSGSVSSQSSAPTAPSPSRSSSGVLRSQSWSTPS